MTTWSPVPGEQSSVALSLLNSRHRGAAGDVDHLRAASEVSGWLAGRGLAAPSVRIGDGEVARLAALRAAVREVLTAVADAREPEPGAVAAVNGAAATAPGAPQLSWSGTGLTRDWVTPDPGSFTAALAAIAADAIDVASGPRKELLRRCEAHGCIRVFLREHARRQWCSTTCGDRVRAARHYQRQQAGGTT
jgi:predicted RNA-binding Zn ribbon-like protein